MPFFPLVIRNILKSNARGEIEPNCATFLSQLLG